MTKKIIEIELEKLIEKTSLTQNKSLNDKILRIIYFG